jgi:hypothetical protein
MSFQVSTGPTRREQDSQKVLSQEIDIKQSRQQYFQKVLSRE